MSDTTTLPAKIDAEHYWLELEGFRDPDWMKNFKFYKIQFKSVEGASKTLDRAGKSGADIVVALINSVISARMRTKAKLKVTSDGGPDLEEVKKREATGNFLLIDEKEASEYSPGEREPESDSGLYKQYQLNLKRAKESKAAGDTESSAKFIELARTYWEELQQKSLKNFDL